MDSTFDSGSIFIQLEAIKKKKKKEKIILGASYFLVYKLLVVIIIIQIPNVTLRFKSFGRLNSKKRLNANLLFRRLYIETKGQLRDEKTG